MTVIAANLAGLRAAVIAFDPRARDGQAWVAPLAALTSAPDLADPAHRGALLRWLNSWGCRIRYPRPGEENLFDQGAARWWERWGRTLPPATAGLADLDEEHLAAPRPGSAAGAVRQAEAGRATHFEDITRDWAVVVVFGPAEYTRDGSGSPAAG